MSIWKILPLVIISLLLISCGGAKPVPTSPATPTAPSPPAIDASSLFTTRCAACHGTKREGITGLGLPLTPQSLAARSDAEIRDTITNGRAGTAMIAWKDILSPAEIEALVKLVKYTSP